MKNNLESKIQEYYFKTLPEARDDRLEQLIDMAKLKMNHYESVDPSPSFLSFYLSSCRSEERRVGKECRFRWSLYH